MSQPTREEFNNHETRIKKLEQQTEPIPVAHVAGTPEDILKKLNAIDKKLDRIDTKQDEHATGLLAHSRVVEVKGTMATKDDLTAMATKDDIASIKATQDQILMLLQQKPGQEQS